MQQNINAKMYKCTDVSIYQCNKPGIYHSSYIAEFYPSYPEYTMKNYYNTDMFKDEIKDNKCDRSYSLRGQ